MIRTIFTPLVSRTTRLRAMSYSAVRMKLRLIPEQTPSPVRLPPQEQQEFERLQRIAQSQAAIDEYNIQVLAEETYLSPKPVDIGGFQFFKTVPEFEGETNPETGEVGGPKQNPLRHPNEWAYNGRVTDF